jgi:hypothetical protein
VDANLTCQGSYVLQLTVTDGAGCTSTCSLTVEIEDNIVPVFAACPINPIDLGCNPVIDDFPTTAEVIAAAGTVTDACGSTTVTAELTTDAVDDCAHTNVWTVTATDGCGNEAVCLVTYTWTSDTVDPQFTACPTASINLGCNPAEDDFPTEALVIAAAGAVTDNCDVASVTAVGGTISGTCNKSQTWTITALDDCGNDAICSVTYTWTSDIVDPQFTTCPATPINLGCNPMNLPDAASAIAAAGTATDACGSVSVSAELTTDAVDDCAYSNVWTVTATDGCGNENTCTVNFFCTTDTQGPLFSNCPTAPINLGNDPPPITAAQAINDAGGATDNCGTPTYTATGGMITGSCNLTQTWTVTAFDGCGGTGICLVTYNWTEGAVELDCPESFSLCLDAQPYDLTTSGATPPGGTFSGTGVNMNLFNPVIAGVGFHTITYYYDDPVGDCDGTCTFMIEVKALPIVTTGTYGPFCSYEGTIALGGTPEGGVWSGEGVTGDILEGFQFYPGAGTQTITYTVTGMNGCTNSASTTIEVNPAPVVDCPANFSVCADDAPFILTGGSPAGGMYSGLGVNAGVFDPSSGIGPHLINYSYTDGNGCTAFCAFFITVNGLPIVNCPSNFSVDQDAEPFLLTGANPTGGTYSGAGVTANTFDPDAAGAGLHLITYTYVNIATGCTNTCTFTITVIEVGECTSTMEWVFLPPGTIIGSCPSMTNCCTNTICYGLQYTPEHSGLLEDYTTGFTVPCSGPNSPIISNVSCVMSDNSYEINGCGPPSNAMLFNSSGNNGLVPVTACVPLILHKVCFSIPLGESLTITEDAITDLTTNILIDEETTISEFQEYITTTLLRPLPVAPEDDGETVACPQLATPPVYPVVLDYCGSPIPAVVINTVDVPDPVTCEGSRVYTYQYTECSGYQFTWNYTYTIIRNDFSVPMNGNSQVACSSAATASAVTVPEVSSDCNETLTITGPVTNQFETDTYDGCEGTISYTWTFTDCDMNSHPWTHTFDVQHTPPTEIGGPVLTSSTINCYLEADPPILPVIEDACGNTLVLSGPVIGGTNNEDCYGTITYSYNYMDCDGSIYPWVYTYNVSCDPVVLKVWLEGPYNMVTNNMKTLMNSLHTLPGQNAPLFYIDYPAGQPYNAAPWNYNGAPSNTGTQWGDFAGQTPYPPGVVDWILVIIRKGGITPAFTIWTCAGWVHQNGDVTFPENCPLPAFLNDDYYFVVQHRNHLGILSPAEVDMPCGTAVLEWDFRNSNSYQPLFRFGQKEVEPGVWAMFSSNGEQIGSIQAINSLDRTLWKIMQGTHGYNQGDFDLNAFTDGFDETLWKNNQNRTTGVVFY